MSDFLTAPMISAGATARGERRSCRIGYVDDFLAATWPHLPRGTPFCVLPEADFDAIIAATEDRPLLALDRIVTIRMAGRKRARTEFLRGVLAGIWLLGLALFVLKVIAG